MFIAKIVGVVISTCKEKSLNAQKLLIVENVIDGETRQSMLAIDSVGAGIGEIVLVVYDGGAARQAAGCVDAPVNAAVVGILDYPELYHSNEK